MKTCKDCGLTKPVDNFNWSDKSRGVLRARCKECFNIKQAKDRMQDPKYRTASLDRNRQYVWSHLKENPCVDCGYSDPRALEFDHVKGTKVDDISTLIWKMSSIKRIQEEIDKCVVRCANCHRIVTAARGNWWRATIDSPTIVC